MRNMFVIATAALVLTVAGCKQEEAKAPEQKPAETQSNAPAAPATEPAKDAATPEPQKQQTAQDTTAVTNNACLAEAKKQTGESDISVTSNEFSEANTLVMLAVGAQKAPWRCLVSNDGQVAEMSFTGDDSAGVRVQPQSTSEVPQAAIDACLAAVTSQTGNNVVKVLSSEFSEANSLVMIGVGEQQAPWRCLVSNDGTVQEVTSQADEGQL